MFTVQNCRWSAPGRMTLNQLDDNDFSSALRQYTYTASWGRHRKLLQLVVELCESVTVLLAGLNRSMGFYADTSCFEGKNTVVLDKGVQGERVQNGPSTRTCPPWSSVMHRHREHRSNVHTEYHNDKLRTDAGCFLPSRKHHP